MTVNFESLPKDVLQTIFSNLDLPSIGRVARVSKKCSEATNDQTFWKMAYTKAWTGTIYADEVNWKELYQRWATGKAFVVLTPQDLRMDPERFCRLVYLKRLEDPAKLRADDLKECELITEKLKTDPAFERSYYSQI